MILDNKDICQATLFSANKLIGITAHAPPIKGYDISKECVTLAQKRINEYLQKKHIDIT